MRLCLWKSTVLFILLAAALTFSSAGELHAGDEDAFNGNFGGGFAATSPPCPLEDFPTLESIIPVPDTVDPFEQSMIRVFCQVDAERKGRPVNKAKGRYAADLYVFDTVSRRFQIFKLDSGKLKTGENGSDRFDFEIPTEIFADGFESGNVSAWSSTRADFTTRKGDRASVACDSAAGPFGAGCAQQSCTVRSSCDLGDLDGDGNSEICLSGTWCSIAEGGTCNSKDNVLGKCKTSFVIDRTLNPSRSCECNCET